MLSMSYGQVQSNHDDSFVFLSEQWLSTATQSPVGVR